MADLSDVLNALATCANTALYPAGALDGDGSVLASVAGPVVKVMRGTPFAKQLDEDLRAGIVNVTVNERPDIGRTTTRFPLDWQTGDVPAATLTTLVAGNSLAIGGTASAGQGILISIDGQSFAYQTQAGDTPTSIANTLAALVLAERMAVASGPVLTVPSARVMVARAVVQGTSIRPTRQQQAGLVIKVFAPSFALRDAVASAADAALSTVSRLTLADGSVAMLRYSGTSYDDRPQKALTFIRTMLYQAEYSTTQKMSSATIGAYKLELRNRSADLTTTILTQGPTAPIPKLLIGAIRFDGFYLASARTGSQSALNADYLSPAQFNYRLPFFASVASGVASWPAATQATIDAEIMVAVAAGLSYWAFDSFQPTDEETIALEFYLSSSIRTQVSFCMLGQVSNWNIPGTQNWSVPYAPSLQRDITMFAQPGYVTVCGGRPLYYMLGAQTTAVMATAVAWIRSQSIAQGTGNPYIVGLAGAGISQFDNVSAWAMAAGCDAAGAYENPPPFNGSPQPYSALVLGAQGDWYARGRTNLPMVPTAMTSFDPRPLLGTPQAESAGWTATNYFAQGTLDEVAGHVSAMAQWIQENAAICPAQTGLIYSWNELVEGGTGIMPTYSPGYPAGNMSLALAVGAVLNAGS